MLEVSGMVGTSGPKYERTREIAAMRSWFLWVAVAACLQALTGCASYRLDRVDQLYLGQSYLPLPPRYVPDEEIRELVQSAPSPSSEPNCELPQPLWRDANGGGRQYAQVLPGMTLRQVQTTYGRNRSFDLPVIVTSEWTVPKTGSCGSDKAWSRESLLNVRHLLSRAVGESSVVNTPPDTDYYLQAARWAGCADGNCSFTEMRKQFLEPFVSNLRVSYRDTGLTWQQTSLGVPPSVVDTQLSDPRNLAGWFGEVNDVRTADFFNFPTPYKDTDSRPLDIGTLCARLKGRSPAAPQFIGEPAQGGSANGFAFRTEVERACNFNLKRLGIPSNTWGTGVAADWAKKLSGGELTLLETGDPLMMFRPAAHAEVLDSASRNVCVAAAGQTSLDCLEHQRVSQGFVDFELLVDVVTSPSKQRVKVPVTMTVKQFEELHANGGRILRIKRSLTWVPSSLVAVDLAGRSAGPARVSASSFSEGGFIEFRFASERSEEWRRSSSLFILDALKEQVLLAPGDILTVAH